MLVPPDRRGNRLLEAETTRQIKDFLQARQWRAIRLQSGKFTNPAGGVFQIGEPGMADFVFVYYLAPIRFGLTCTIYVEMKRQGFTMSCECAKRARAAKKGKCTYCNQREWRHREEVRGAVFGPGDSADRFMEWYYQKFSWLHDGKLPGQGELFV